MSDLFAAEGGPERWTEQGRVHRDELEAGFDGQRVVDDRPLTPVWVGAGDERPLSDDGRMILAARSRPPA